MSARQPIPIPAELRWREFRHGALPMIALVVAVASLIGLWVKYVDQPTIIGRALPRNATVIVPTTGTLTSLKADTFQRVEQGEILAMVTPIGMRTRLDSVRTEIDLIRNRIEPLLERRRDTVSYHRLRLEWLQQRVALAASRVDLQRAENELARDQRLFAEELISADQYDQSQKNVAALAAGVAEATLMVDEMDVALRGIQALDSVNQDDELNQQLQSALAAQEAQLKKLAHFTQAYPLTAPIAGKVTDVAHVAGETVLEGNRILTITQEISTQLLAYVPNPDTLSLETGSEVTLQTRGLDPRTATAKIIGVGPRLQQKSAVSTPAGSVTAPGELSIPILISLPPDLGVRPGESVNVLTTAP